MNNKYLVTCVPGAEGIVSDELLEMDENIKIIKISRGRVTFNFNQRSENLKSLRSVDNIYSIIDHFSIGPYKKDLLDFSKKISQLDFSGKRIIVSAAIKGNHTYSRFDLSKAAEKVFTSNHSVLGTPDQHDLAIRIDVENGQCSICQQLTSAQFRFRGLFNSVKGGIRPSVAHCLVRLSCPFSNEIFYDPFCGGGTIAIERMFYPYKKVFASDINEQVLKKAQANWKKDLILFQADATNTHMKKSSIDTVVTNMPWGKQISYDVSLYYRFFKELNRILKPNGKAIILTDQYKSLYNACLMTGFSSIVKAELSLHGLHPKVFEIKRR